MSLFIQLFFPSIYPAPAMCWTLLSAGNMVVSLSLSSTDIPWRESHTKQVNKHIMNVRRH